MIRMPKKQDLFAKADQVANKLADRAYGENNKETKVNVSISMPIQLKETLEDIVIKNKRSNAEPRNFSALVCSILEKNIK